MRDPVPSQLGLIASLQNASDINLTGDTVKHWLSLRQDIANFISDLWIHTTQQLVVCPPHYRQQQQQNTQQLYLENTGYSMEGKTGKQ